VQFGFQHLGFSQPGLPQVGIARLGVQNKVLNREGFSKFNLLGLGFFPQNPNSLFSIQRIKAESRGQFHQHSTRSFYVRKLHAQLFCAYVLGLCFTVVSLPAQKLRVER
jgi:hypothetical protein